MAADHDDPRREDSAFSQAIAAKAARKLNVQAKGRTGVWYGLGMTGAIGWGVVVPTVLGALLGAWLDRHHPSSHSWTLALLVAGLVLGCANAWHWVAREAKVLQDEPAPPDA